MVRPKKKVIHEQNYFTTVDLSTSESGAASKVLGMITSSLTLVESQKHNPEAEHGELGNAIAPVDGRKRK